MPPEIQPGTPVDWIRHARSDLALAGVMRPKETLLEMLCYHAQQAAEKAIKAVLVHHEVVFPRTHSIGALLELLPGHIDTPESVQNAAELTEYAVEARYPGAMEAVTDDEYERSMSLAAAVVIWAEKVTGSSR